MRGVTDADYAIRDLGGERVLSVRGVEYRTRYSERLIRLLIERKGIERAPLYFPFKETRGRHFLTPLFRRLSRLGARDLRVLEVGCSFGHVTEYLAEQPSVGSIACFDTDADFVAMVRCKVEELGLGAVRDVRHLTNEATCRLPYPDGAFDLVLAIGVIEHLPERTRRAQVDEYYRVLAPGGHIAVLDTPNRLFPLETHSIGLPFVQWLPPRLAYRYARALRRRTYGALTYEEFMADGNGWRNATFGECVPSSGVSGLQDVTEEAGYGWQFFRATAKSRMRRVALPGFAVACAALSASGRSPSLALPYLNLLFRRRAGSG